MILSNSSNWTKLDEKKLDLVTTLNAINFILFLVSHMETMLYDPVWRELQLIPHCFICSPLTSTDNCNKFTLLNFCFILTLLRWKQCCRQDVTSFCLVPLSVLYRLNNCLPIQISHKHYMSVLPWVNKLLLTVSLIKFDKSSSLNGNGWISPW